MNRMTDERLAWWKEQLRTGKLGHNFETLIRDFETERAKVAELEAENDALRNNSRDFWKLQTKAAEAQLTALREELDIKEAERAALEKQIECMYEDMAGESI